jgi:hypothetical protein
MSYFDRSVPWAVGLCLVAGAIVVPAWAQDTKYVQPFSSYTESMILPPPCLNSSLLDEFKADLSEVRRTDRRISAGLLPA